MQNQEQPIIYYYDVKMPELSSRTFSLPLSPTHTALEFEAASVPLLDSGFYETTLEIPLLNTKLGIITK